VPLFFARSCSQSGVDGFIAEADGQIASAALLHLVDGVGYLGWMATAEAFRGRGGQNALIGARITRTAELGCEWVASETLYSLQGSLRNLQRNGFEIVYEKKVFEWRRTW
jgi:GNAT superfamily N-acetyltransferase